MSVTTANWNYPTAVRFGAGRIAELAEACRAAGIKRPLLVTDPGLAKLADHAERARASCATRGFRSAIFSDVQPNPIEANVAAGIAALRKGGHDGVVAFGGGSALDAGKVIAFMAGQTRPMWDFEDVGDWWTRADPDGIAPIVAVPTTAGTGSEVGRAGVITDEATHTKKVIFHPQMMPKRGDLRSGAHRRHAALHHRRHRHGRARPLPRGLLRAGLSPDGRRHRGRGHAARPREPAEGGRQRQRPRGARRT